MTIKLIHAGLGGWGTDWEKNPIPRVSEVERVAIVEPFEVPLRAAQSLLNLPDSACFTDLSEALNTVEADAVLLTVPMEQHVPAAILAMEHGKHVLVEKPFSGSVEEARKAVEFAASKNLTLQVSQNYRYFPAVRTASRLLREEKFGSVSTVRVDFRKYANNRPEPGHRHYSYVHPLLFDMAIHHFDLMRLIVDSEPVSVYARAMDPDWSRFRDEASATVLVEFANGVIVSYRGSWVSTGAETSWAGDWHVECETGEVAFTSRSGDTTTGDAVQLRELGATESVSQPLDPIRLHGRAGGLQAFANAIQSGEEPETSGRNNLGSVALMEASARSLESGKVEAVENPWK